MFAEAERETHTLPWFLLKNVNNPAAIESSLTAKIVTYVSYYCMHNCIYLYYISISMVKIKLDAQKVLLLCVKPES